MRRPARLALLALALAGCTTATAASEQTLPASHAKAARPAPAREKGGRAPGEEARALLAAHNELRARHCAPPLAWSEELARVARGWAEHLRGECGLAHSQGDYGENLWMGTAGAFSTRSVVQSWYDEVSGYRYRPGGFSMATGHFTQVVWTGSKRLGCAKATCQGNELWVCEYDPPGNVEGQFGASVLPPSCRRRATPAPP